MLRQPKIIAMGKAGETFEITLAIPALKIASRPSAEGGKVLAFPNLAPATKIGGAETK
jgi:hypothetical protein